MKKKVYIFENVSYDYYDLLVLNKGFSKGRIQQGDNRLDSDDYFIVFLFAVKKDAEVNFPFVFLNDLNQPCLYVLGSGKNHSQEALPLNPTVCDQNDLSSVTPCSLEVPEHKFYFEYQNYQLTDEDNELYILQVTAEGQLNEDLQSTGLGSPHFFQRHNLKQTITNRTDTLENRHLGGFFYGQFNLEKLASEYYLLTKDSNTDNQFYLVRIPKEEQNGGFVPSLYPIMLKMKAEFQLEIKMEIFRPFGLYLIPSDADK